jgi:hypothetical protein
MVFPTILGAGKCLFGETSDAAALRLVEAKPADETLILIYEPSAKGAGRRELFKTAKSQRRSRYRICNGPSRSTRRSWVSNRRRKGLVVCSTAAAAGSSRSSSRPAPPQEITPRWGGRSKTSRRRWSGCERVEWCSRNTTFRARGRSTASLRTPWNRPTDELTRTTPVRSSRSCCVVKHIRKEVWGSWESRNNN